MSKFAEKLRREYTRAHERALARLEKARSFDELSSLCRGYNRWRIRMMVDTARFVEWQEITEEEYRDLVRELMEKGSEFRSKFEEKAQEILKSWIESLFRS